MENDEPVVIPLNEAYMADEYARLMDELPYETPGQLRDAVFAGGDLCCPNCYDYMHPHADAWQGMLNWLFLMGLNWREVN
jgi:hypothetical protein